MQITQERKLSGAPNALQTTGNGTEPVRMHPDDYSALLAWITAKRFHELVREKTVCHLLSGYSRMG